MIRFGMALMEMIEQLTKGFIKSTGRQPDNLEKLKIQQEAVQRFKDMNKVVDMEGKAIDTSKGIMGGKQIKDSPEFGARIRETYDKAKGPGKGQEMVDALKSPGAKKSYKIIEDQLGVKLYGDETFDEILKIQKTGKHPRGEPKIRSMVEDAIDNASLGFVRGDRKYNAQLVAEDLAEKKFGKEFYDLDQKQQIDLYDEALEGLSKQTRDMPDPEDLAQGGRVGLKKGMDRRTFMKIMGGLTTLPILGKFAKGAKLVEPAVKKAAEITAPALDKIIEAVMSAGKLVSQSGRRLKELTTKKKLKGVEVEEDMMDGPSYTIKTKDKTIYYRPGRMDEGGLDDDIIEVIEDTVTKKAGGGIARMLGE